jgi:hypothetical protein
VTAIKECKDLDSLRRDDLVGSRVTYKRRRFQPKKNKNLALRSFKKENKVVCESSNEDTFGTNVMYLLTRNFHMFLKSSKRSSKTTSTIPSKVGYQSYYHSGSHSNSRGKNTRDRKDKKYKGIQCYECSGYVHVRANCENLKNSKDNARNASVSDEFESDDS